MVRLRSWISANEKFTTFHIYLKLFCKYVGETMFWNKGKNYFSEGVQKWMSICVITVHITSENQTVNSRWKLWKAAKF